MKVKFLFFLLMVVLTLLLIPSSSGIVDKVSELTWEGYTNGFLKARNDGKPIMIDFYAEWCYYCIVMENTTYRSEEVIDRSSDFVFVKVDGDDNPKLMTEYRIEVYPTTVFLMPDGAELKRIEGYIDNGTMINELEAAQVKFDELYDPEQTDYPPIVLGTDVENSQDTTLTPVKITAVMIGVIATVVVIVVAVQGKRR